MEKKQVYTVCGMCTVRCPAMAVVKDGKCTYVQGNPHAAGIKGALCARGAAGPALTNDEERPKYPMIRTGERGEGKWKRVSWDEALDYVAEKLQAVRSEYGDRSLLFSDRGGPFRDFHRAFLRGMNTPNYCNHDAACARNIQHAALSVFGFGRKGVCYDLKNAKHVVLQTRNMFEAINVKEVNDLLDAKENGCRVTVIDIRANISASKADNFFMIRPGTDYAFNLAVIHMLLDKGLYNKAFVEKWVDDLEALRNFVEPYTLAWAEEETGIPAAKIEAFVKELVKAAPSVIWHPGWMTARYEDSFYMSRTAYIINSLLGSIGARGGLPIMMKPGDAGRKGLNSFMNLYPKPEEKRADGVGWKYPHWDQGPGMVQMAYQAIETGDPYPVKAYIAFRHDPLMAFPDPDRLRSIFDKLDLMVSVTFSWSDTAWYSDVVLPLSPYLERDSVLATKNGLKPQFFARFRAMEPLFDTRSEWEIFSGLAKRFGIDKLVYDNIEDVWNFQLEGTGVTIDDFRATGMVPLTDEALYVGVDDLKFKTPSGKIEILSSRLDKAGIESLKPYKSPARPPAGAFRIAFGRCAVHTQGHTVNNPLLHEQVSENLLWINDGVAADMGIEDGEYVAIGVKGGTERIKAYVTEFVHPECVFMLHGFGHKLPVESRAKGKGVADHELMPGGLDKYDKAGGAVAMQEHFVVVEKAQ